MTGEGLFRGDDSTLVMFSEGQMGVTHDDIPGTVIELTVPLPISLTAIVRLVSVVPISLEGESCCFPPFSPPLHPEGLVSGKCVLFG
jgi:hypothetical protein